MPQPNEPIASSRAKVFVIPPGGEPFLLGLVEDFSASSPYQSENIGAIGEFVPPAQVVNTTQGQFRWGKVQQLNAQYIGTVIPEVERYAQYRAFDLLLIDPVDEVPIAQLVDCLPTMLDVNVTNGRALRGNYSGICRYVKHGDQILQG